MQGVLLTLIAQQFMLTAVMVELIALLWLHLSAANLLLGRLVNQNQLRHAENPSDELVLLSMHENLDRAWHLQPAVGAMAHQQQQIQKFPHPSRHG
jgi:hypothetical protein